MTSDEVIELLYKGDVKLYEEVIRNTNQYVNPCDPDLQLALSWHTVQRAAECYPMYEEKSLKIIKNFLHYLPSPQIYIPHQPFIKALIASHERGDITEKEVIQELEFHCKRIRNDDMKKYGWAKQGKYEPSDYDLYETYLPAYKQKARARLAKIIGYEPPLEYSLGAELFMRHVFLSDDFRDDQPSGMYERRAVIIGSYREAMVERGPEAADDSILYGIFICNRINVSPYSSKKYE